MANTSGTLMSGWLCQREKRKSWKNYWFVLKEQVLYVYKASEDVLPISTMPILGYSIQEFQEVRTLLFLSTFTLYFNNYHKFNMYFLMDTKIFI